MNCVATGTVGPDKLEETLELAGGRARDLRALLDAVEFGELFAETPPSAGGRARHTVGVAMLAVRYRELAELAALLQAAGGA